MEVKTDYIASSEYTSTVAKFRAIADQCAAIFAKKHAGYGPKNISELGPEGVFDRMKSDKVQRLTNLLKVKDQLDWNDPEVADVLIDIANYAIIMLMLLRKQWPQLEPFDELIALVKRVAVATNQLNTMRASTNLTADQERLIEQTLESEVVYA